MQSGKRAHSAAASNKKQLMQETGSMAGDDARGTLERGPERAGPGCADPPPIR